MNEVPAHTKASIVWEFAGYMGVPLPGCPKIFRRNAVKKALAETGRSSNSQ